MQASEQLIRSVVEEVLAQVRGAGAPVSPSRADGRDGVFRRVDDAVSAARDAFLDLQKRTVDDRKRAIDCIRRVVIDQAEELGRSELEETQIGRLDHKIEKLQAAGRRTPGVEFLRCDAASGDHGLTVTEYAPFGVIGVITPVTHSLPTLTGNAINMIAAGNTLVCNPHPSGARIACEGVRRFNRAIRGEIGVDNLVTIVDEPTLETAQAIFEHRDVRLLCVTGGPGVARAALASRKRAIVAGPGNPPVVVDETADLEKAARSIVAGAAYDNNLLCIGEKQVFAVEGIFDELLQAMARSGGHRLGSRQIEALTAVAFQPAEPASGNRSAESRLVVNKDLTGKDPAALAERAGFSIPDGVELLFGETDVKNPFVPHEQMMPFVPFVRCRDACQAIERARESEHGFKHTSLIHSRDVHAMTRMGRELDTTLFVKNGPSMAALGLGGEGFLSFSIATPTGEGVTSPLTFTRQRRCTMVDELRII
jgi:aldehyde dehydrogenase